MSQARCLKLLSLECFILTAVAFVAAKNITSKCAKAPLWESCSDSGNEQEHFYDAENKICKLPPTGFCFTKEKTLVDDENFFETAKDCTETCEEREKTLGKRSTGTEYTGNSHNNYLLGESQAYPAYQNYPDAQQAIPYQAYPQYSPYAPYSNPQSDLNTAYNSQPYPQNQPYYEPSAQYDTYAPSESIVYPQYSMASPYDAYIQDPYQVAESNLYQNYQTVPQNMQSLNSLVAYKDLLSKYASLPSQNYPLKYYQKLYSQYAKGDSPESSAKFQQESAATPVKSRIPPNPAYAYDVSSIKGQFPAQGLGTYPGYRTVYNPLMLKSPAYNKIRQDFIDICTLPLDEGRRGVTPGERWAYDPNVPGCIPFYYRGAGGNFNKFTSKESCVKHCITEIENYERHY